MNFYEASCFQILALKLLIYTKIVLSTYLVAGMCIQWSEHKAMTKKDKVRNHSLCLNGETPKPTII